MKIPVTDEVLDKLGFSEYWDENCTWGGRTLEFSNGTKFRIVEQLEMDDEFEGHHPNGIYVPHHFYFVGWFAIPKLSESFHTVDLFFLHDMYKCLNKFYPDCIPEFMSKLIELRMDKHVIEELKISSN